MPWEFGLHAFAVERESTFRLAGLDDDLIHTCRAQARDAAMAKMEPSPAASMCLPLADVVITDWTMEEAMSFVMTGGTNAPDRVRFRNPPHAVAEAAVRPSPAPADPHP